MTREPPDDADPPGGRPRASADRAAFTLASIRPVRDFTARKTLEQVHAFVEGVARIFREGDTDEESARLVRELARVGVTEADADQLAAQAIALVEVMADRDRKADVFQAAVREAGQSERAMYDRLAGFAHLLRHELGATSPALARFGIPPAAPEDARGKGRPPAKPISSASIAK
jgi:hypothetical protein